MASQRNVTVYTCDYPDCAGWTVGRSQTWWLGRQEQFCPEHRPKCKRCDQPMRHQRQTVAQVPGTLRVGAQGMCDTCLMAVKRAKNVPAIDGVDEQKIRYVKRKIAEWMENPDDMALVLETLGLAEVGDDID